jgi:hypothetical protein
MPTAAIIENMVTIVVAGATVIGLYAFGAGCHAGWGFLLLINLNYPRRRTTE